MLYRLLLYGSLIFSAENQKTNTIILGKLAVQITFMYSAFMQDLKLSQWLKLIKLS
jgi:hypothetical protein